MSINLCTFAAAFKTMEHWRDGRVVDYSSLENYRTERYRGFESLSLRKEFNEIIVGLFFCDLFGGFEFFSYLCTIIDHHYKTLSL